VRRVPCRAQVTAGPCASAKPWGWNAIESAKWNSWMQLGDMASTEAMELYVATMEEENPDWWELVTNNGEPDKVAEVQAAAAEAVATAGIEAMARAEATARASGSAGAGSDSGGASANDATSAISRIIAPPGVWTKLTPPQVLGRAPRGRYSHAAAIVGGNMFVVGGHGGGRLMGDVHVLNIASMKWSVAATTMAATSQLSADASSARSDQPAATAVTDAASAALAVSFTPRAGHAAVVWGSRVLVVGGRTQGGGAATATAAAAIASDTCEVWMLETGAMEWQRLALGGMAPPPPARSGHTATMVHGTNKVVIFGGEDRRGRLLNDVHVIDLGAMEWVTPGKGAVMGHAPSPRAGHVAASLPGRKDVFVFGGVAAGAAGEVSGALFALDAEVGPTQPRVTRA
jgi:hypothetical protein